MLRSAIRKVIERAGYDIHRRPVDDTEARYQDFPRESLLNAVSTISALATSLIPTGPILIWPMIGTRKSRPSHFSITTLWR
jgi:hypothetical protein